MTALLKHGTAASSRAELLGWATSLLGDAGSASPGLDATVLMAWLLRIPPTTIAADRLEAVSEPDGELYRAWVHRRASGEPVAYITGHKRFMGLDLLVDRRALLVRPLTEKVAEMALEVIRVRQCDRLVAADVGTGSGAMAVALTVLEPAIARLYATDVSPAALALARANARRYRVDDRVISIEGDLLEPVPEPVDLLVANLPYVPAGATPAQLTDHEPLLAFEGGPDGTAILRRFLGQLPGRLREGGALVMEIGPGQRDVVVNALNEAVPEATVAPPLSQAWGHQVVLARVGPARLHVDSFHADREG